MFKWNKPFKMVMEIKKDYINSVGELDTYDFNTWVEKLDNEKYNNFLEPLQVNQYKNFLLIRYGLAEMQRGMWEDKESIYRQCRSVVIDLENDELALTPFKKFFNINEVEENNVDNLVEKIKQAKVFEISNKLDGSMISIRYYKGDYLISTSMTLNEEISWRLQDAKEMFYKDKSIMEFVKDYSDYTFVFEYISLRDAHVVIYNKEDEGLYLLGMVNTYTGEELDYSKVISLGERYKVKCVELEDITLDDVLEKSKELKSNEKEGWVLNIDGHKVKIKCDDYVNIHRMLDRLSSINVIIQSIANNTYDDLISKIPFSYRKRVDNIADVIFNYVIETKKVIEKYYDKAPKGDKKEFMVWVEKNVPKEYKKYLREKYLYGEYNVLKSRSGKYKKIKDIVGEDVDYSCLFWGDV